MNKYKVGISINNNRTIIVPSKSLPFKVWVGVMSHAGVSQDLNGEEVFEFRDKESLQKAEKVLIGGMWERA